jgi:phosphoglycolate phosphatase-like HAD superfamily hydrolase
MKNLHTRLIRSEGIVFDLDGTLLHTEPDIRLALNSALNLT